MSNGHKDIESWIGVDLDGTLAHYDGWRGLTHIGEPIPAMVERVKGWLAQGKQVKIFTARAGPQRSDVLEDTEAIRAAIKQWCLKHIGQVLPVTATKDYGMVELWDDRAIQVVTNTGKTATSIAQILLDWIGAAGEIWIGPTYEDRLFEVGVVRGNRNDREYHKLAEGHETATSALLAAMRADSKL